jgi:hypothetical protein
MTSVSTLAAPPAADLWPGDQYRFADLLTDTERAVLVRLRAVLDAQVRPLLDEYWERGEFPSQVLPHLIALDLMEPAGALYAGFRNFELARTDCSVATMYNAHPGCSARRSATAAARRSTTPSASRATRKALTCPSVQAGAYEAALAYTTGRVHEDGHEPAYARDRRARP